MNQRNWWHVFLAVLALALAPGIAVAAPELDKDYRVIQPAQATDAGNKIEVTEFFYYGCPHCFELESALKTWLKKKPKDVEFRQQPAVFRDTWVPLTRTFYALESMGLLDEMHEKVYQAIHDDGLGLSDEGMMTKWVGQQGVDPRKFSEAYRSFAVQNKTQRAIQITRDYQVRGTPSIVVAGKYVTSPAMTGNVDKFFQVVDELIDMARKEAATKKS